MKNDVWEATQLAPLDDEADPAPSDALLDAKVMMVDDEPLMTDLISTYLEDEGYRNFVVTNDPHEAIALLRREDPDVLLLDLMMPGLSGFDVLQAMRADRTLRYTPVIVLTASTGAEAKLRALRLGATDFLAKPVDESELVLRVRNTLAFRQYHKQLVDFDRVTKLPNATLFDRDLATILDRRALVGGTVALFSIHEPECRRLSESVDRAASDDFVRTLAQRLERFARQEAGSNLLATSVERAARVARLGADQFCLVLEGLDCADAVEAAARRLCGQLSAPVALGLYEVIPQPWIGISMCPGDGADADALRRSADLAATDAAARGAAPYQFSSPALNQRSHERLSLGSQLRGAVQRGELVLHYQPKVDLRNGRIVAAEALVRWQHPEHGLLPPGRFVPLAEELGLITRIGEWVIQQACRDAAAWTRAGLGTLRVAINVAKPQFANGELCKVLRCALFDSALSAERLIIELTESMLMNDLDSGVALMNDIKALGATLSIDDFGTGYSSLNYLKRLPLDELKIDRSFVVDLPGERADLAVVRTVIELGHSLGMTVTAEGVETEQQRDCLAQLGCDVFQGFLFSRPISSEDLMAMLRNEAAKDARD